MKKRFFALVTLVVIMLASCFAFIACNKSKGGSGNGGGKISASSNSSSITTPSGGDISKVDVFTENAEYKEFYDIVDKIENAFFATTNVQSNSLTGNIYKSAYNSGKSLEGYTNVINTVFNKLNADEQAGFQPEAMNEMYTTYKSMFSSTFSLAKQMGDGITRIKGEKSLYGKVMRLAPTAESGDYYYVIEKDGNHIQQIIYAPEQVYKVDGGNNNNELSVSQEYFAFADIYYEDDNNFSFITLTVWGENEQLAFSYGNNQKKIAYGNLNGNELSSLAWADGDLTGDTKQITYNASTEKCKEIAPNLVDLYNYIDKNYIKSVVNRPVISLTQEEVDEITKIWAEEAINNQDENSPWKFINNVLVSCDFANSDITPTETVTIPDGVVMLSADFRITERSDIVKNLIIPSSCTQLKKLDSTNRWVTVDAKNFCPIIEVQNERTSKIYKFEYIKSSSPLFKTDAKSGTLLTSDNKAFYLFDRQATVYDLSGVELDSNISNSQWFEYRYLNQVRKIIANANKIYRPEEEGEEVGGLKYSFYYDFATIYRLCYNNGIDLDVLEIHVGNPPKISEHNKYTENDENDIIDRLTLNVRDPLNGADASNLKNIDKIEVRELKIVAEGYKYVVFQGGVDERYKYLTDYTSENLQSFISSVENKNASKFQQWKDELLKRFEGYNEEEIEERISFDNFYYEEYFTGNYPGEEGKYYDEYDKYCMSKYILAFRKKYPGTKNYSVIRNCSVSGGAKFIGEGTTEIDYETYKLFGNFNGEIQTVNISKDYIDIRIDSRVDVDKPYKPITFNISANAKYININFRLYPERNEADVYDYAFTSPYFIIKLPVTQSTIEKAENLPLLLKIFHAKENYEEIKTRGMFSEDRGIKYEFATNDDGVNALVSNYWFKSGTTLLGYLDETGSCGGSITLPSDCDTVTPSNLDILTVGKINKIVIPDSYKYFNSYGIKKSVIEKEDAGLFSLSLVYLVVNESNSYYRTYRVRTIELTGNSPLFSISDKIVYSKDGSVELTYFTKSLSDRNDLPYYPGMKIDDDNYSESYLLIDQDFIDKDLFYEYNFEFVRYIIYSENISGSIDVDLEKLAIKPHLIVAIILQKNNVSSVNLNVTDSNKLSQFGFSFNCTKAEFENAYSLEQQAMFFNGLFAVPDGYTFEDFKQDNYCYCTNMTDYGDFSFVRLCFTDSVEPVYDVTNEGVDMETAGKKENFKATDINVVYFNYFEGAFSYYVTFSYCKMNYNLGENEKITSMIFYFNCSQEAFMQYLEKGNFADFIGWEYFEVGGKSFEDFKAENFVYKNGNKVIKFCFGTGEFCWYETPAEPERFVLEVASRTTKINFAKKGGAYYCDLVTFNTLPTVKITEVNYGLTGDQRISNINFQFFNITKQEFLETYVNEEDVFGFKNTNYFAMELDFSNPTSEDECTVLFSQDGEPSVFIAFSFKMPEQA